MVNKQLFNKINCAGTPVFIGNNSFNELNNILTSTKYDKIFIILDENTSVYCLPFLLKVIPILKCGNIIQLASGEKSKTIEVCLQIWPELMKMNINRQSLILNIGGGVVCDMGGFIAATIKRGVDFINIPTTLMAMVDAAIGGKVGVDLKEIKNQIGLYSLPKAIIVYPDFFYSLSERQIYSGFAEMIKHALIADANYWKEIKKTDFSVKTKMVHLITRSIEIKTTIVNEDFKENNIRKSLNFGHTVGHAFESHSLQTNKNPLLHGEAIAAGMICEAYISYKLCGLTTKHLEEIVAFIYTLYQPYSIKKKQFPDIIKILRFDKKNSSTTLNLALITAIGASKINCKCSEELIIESLNFYTNL